PPIRSTTGPQLRGHCRLQRSGCPPGAGTAPWPPEMPNPVLQPEFLAETGPLKRILNQETHPWQAFLSCAPKFLLACLAVTVLRAWPMEAQDYGGIELVRDTWGIPHIFSDTDPGAMYGLGYATAEQRGFQMTYNLRIIQGRLAEVLGDRQRGTRKETAVDHDRKMRTIGWAGAAVRTATN